MNKNLGFMKHNRMAKSAVLALLLMGVSLTADARGNIELRDTVQYGFNAMDHLLQRPAPARKFENPKRFGDNLFISAGLGTSYFSGVTSGHRNSIGWKATASLGDWITPVHGWRITANAGTYGRVNANRHHLYFGGVSADYLMNFSNLLRGEDHSRWFELVGALGVRYEMGYSSGYKGTEVGVHAALQARFYPTQSLFFYVEPEIAYLRGYRFGSLDWRRFKTNMALSVGMGYRLLSKRERAFRSIPFDSRDESNLFFGVGAGVTGFLRGSIRNARHNANPTGHFFVGKMFTPAIGLRVNGQAGTFGYVENHRNRYMAEVGLNLVWNLNSTFGGYRNEVFDLSLNAGPTLSFVSDTGAGLRTGLEGSATALFRITPNWGIYVEPKLQTLSRRVTNLINGGMFTPAFSVMAGIRYNIGDFPSNFPRSYEDYNKSKNNFLNYALGYSGLYRNGNIVNGMAGNIGFGRRFTPISSWRINLDGQMFRSQRSMRNSMLSLGVNADYMFSISTTMAGFNPDRLFDVSGVLGVGAGYCSTDSHNAYFMGKAGLHGAFRLSESLDLYIEPQLLAANYTGGIKGGWRPEGRVMVGLTYRLGNNGYANDLSAPANPDDAKRNFISFVGGPSLFSYTLFRSDSDKVNGSFDLNIGHWFTNVSGARVGVAYDFSPERSKPSQFGITSAHIDYMLNMSSLMDSNPARRFHVIGIVGLGFGKSSVENAKVGAMANAGMQFRYDCSESLSVNIEPNAAAWANRVLPRHLTDSNRFFVFGKVLCGLTYRF